MGGNSRYYKYNFVVQELPPMFVIYDTVTDTAVIVPIKSEALAQEGADYANRLRKSTRFIVKQVS